MNTITENVSMLRDIAVSPELDGNEREAVVWALRMIEWAAKNAQYRECGVPLWSNVGCVFGYGSTSSIEICKALGLDPFEVWECEEEETTP